MKHHMAFAETQSHETHTDFEHGEKQPDFTTQFCVVVVGESDMRVKGLVEGTAVEWKIDTGAANTFISKEVYLSILPQNRPVLEQVRKQFETADGRPLNVIGTANMILTFGKKDIYFRVFVGGVKCNLLGKDFMMKIEYVTGITGITI